MPTNEHDEDQRKLEAADAASADAAQEAQEPVAAAEAVDPWAAAFEATASAPAAPADPAAAGADDASGQPAVPGGAAAGDAAAVGEPGDGAVGAGDTGGLVPGAAESGDAAGAGALGAADVEAKIAEYSQLAEQQSVQDTARLFLDKADDQGRKLIRQTNGVLGATINDPDIYQVIDGVPTFVNPDTGKPFTGDNPRAQAKQWVDMYNEELRETFNQMAAERKVELEKQMAPVVEMLKFVPVFEKLDPVRQQMLDALIEDHEVYDESGAHIGYDCDLNQMLARVNKQVAAIQASQQTTAPAAPVVDPNTPTGPAIDMRASGSGSAAAAETPKSLEEAMAQIQQRQLDALK